MAKIRTRFNLLSMLQTFFPDQEFRLLLPSHANLKNIPENGEAKEEKKSLIVLIQKLINILDDMYIERKKERE